MNRRPFCLDGKEVDVPPGPGPSFAGAALLGALGGGGIRIPDPDDAPYLFCANGACRDCNVMAEGLADVPACRLFLAPGMSLRSGDGAGEENALSRNLGRPASFGEPLAADVAVIGGGPAGRAAAAAARESRANAVLLEARKRPGDDACPRPVGVSDGQPFVMDEGRKRLLRARTIIIATGARDCDPRVPGSTLAGALPLTLLDRYLGLGFLPGHAVFVAGGDVDEAALRRFGAASGIAVADPRSVVEISGRHRVERVRVRQRDGVETEHEADLVFLRLRREPALEIARALGCRAAYDGELGYDRLVVGGDGATSVRGVYACGDVVRIGTAEEADRAGARAGRAAAAAFEAGETRVLE